MSSTRARDFSADNIECVSILQALGSDLTLKQVQHAWRYICIELNQSAQDHFSEALKPSLSEP